MKISQATRRNIFDAMSAEGVRWSGRLEEPEFLARIFDLESLPSNDKRFANFRGDIWQHRINNFDWNDDWVFYNPRLNLLNGDDEVVLRFLCETIHPIVRSDAAEVSRLQQLYNKFLADDGFELTEQTRLSNRPVFIGREIGIRSNPGVAVAKNALSGLDPGYISQQITRMEAAVSADPDLAIGTAKELIESVCKTILTENGVEYSSNADVIELVKLTREHLSLTPDDIPDKAKAAKTIKRLLSNLGNVAQGLAELRNLYGTGHGKVAGAKGLLPRHAKLAVGAAATLATFLAETYQER